MKKVKKLFLFLVLEFLIGVSILVISGNVMAGNLEPPGPPGSTMKTLDEVEPRIPISSLPIIISQSGSYYLSGDLSLSNGIGIWVQTDDVTIDLMGYTISNTGSASRGIFIDSCKNVEIRDGTVKGFSVGGILDTGASGNGHRAIHIRAVENSVGINLTGSGGIVKDCSANYNINYGINATSYGEVITNNTANYNGTFGIWVGDGNVIINNTARGNGNNGINAGSGNTIINNTARGNGNNGINAGRGNTIINNTAYRNDGNGIVAEKSTIKNNTSNENVKNGFDLSSCLVDGNTAIDNNRGLGGYVNLYCSICSFGLNHAP